MTFLGKISFPSKVPEFLYAFQFSRKVFSSIFLGLTGKCFAVPLCCVHCARFDILSYL